MIHCRVGKYVCPRQIAAMLAAAFKSVDCLRAGVFAPRERIHLQPTDDGIILMALTGDELLAMRSSVTFDQLSDAYALMDARCPVSWYADPGHYVEQMLQMVDIDSYGLLSNRKQLLVPLQIDFVLATHHHWPKLAHAIDRAFAKYTRRRVNRWWQRLWRGVKELRKP